MQSKPVNEVVYGQVVFDKVALANRILKEGPVKVRPEFNTGLLDNLFSFFRFVDT